MKTSELIGPALDWAVAKCEGYSPVLDPKQGEWSQKGWWQLSPNAWRPLQDYSTEWAQGGPIIERERITLISEYREIEDGWLAESYDGKVQVFGSTPLIAAMRCYVASKLGNEVEIPGELQ